MVSRTREERLFGAACLRAMLDRTGQGKGPGGEIYQGALEDLGVTEAEVLAYLDAHRAEVEAALERRRAARPRD